MLRSGMSLPVALSPVFILPFRDFYRSRDPSQTIDFDAPVVALGGRIAFIFLKALHIVRLHGNTDLQELAIQTQSR